MSEIILSSENFEHEVLQSTVPVLVDFWATWCGPCMMLAPTVEQLAKEANGQYKVCKVNVDEQGALAMRFGIESIPTVLVFRDGKLAGKSVGLRPKEALLSLLGL